MNVNENFLKLRSNYLFSDVARRTKEYKAAHPDQRIIKLGIGDVVLPLGPAIITAMHTAVNNLSNIDTFHGYGLEVGNTSLRTLIHNDYISKGLPIDLDEIFISDGAGSDIGNIGELFSHNCKVAISDPVYPAYIDSNVIDGRSGEYINNKWSNISYMPSIIENDFVPQLPSTHTDVIYICSPNNPTGIALNKHQLKDIVDYALANDSLIIYDGAYEAFIRNKDIPHSIYEIEGSNQCAIEIRSFSKTAGFTGVRLGYTIVPKALTVCKANNQIVNLNHFWTRRQCTKFNGASYISQCGAEAIYTPEGHQQIMQNINYYMDNSKLLRESLLSIGINAFGGTDGPYVWMQTPQGMGSWQFFDILLNQLQIICTPGVGFGPSGEGFCRLSSFALREDVEEAVQRIKNLVL